LIRGGSPSLVSVVGPVFGMTGFALLYEECDLAGGVWFGGAHVPGAGDLPAVGRVLGISRPRVVVIGQAPPLKHSPMAGTVRPVPPPGYRLGQLVPYFAGGWFG
jgi:hypothetical protein